MNKILVNKHNCVFGLAGFSNSGKTTLTVSLIKIFSQKGFSVGSIKHAHHNFQIDQPGKDSWKHRKAGSQEVIVSSTKRIAHIIERKNGKEATLKELLSLSSKKDILIVEGFKKEYFPKLEVWRENITADKLFWCFLKKCRISGMYWKFDEVCPSNMFVRIK